MTTPTTTHAVGKGVTWPLSFYPLLCVSIIIVTLCSTHTHYSIVSRDIINRDFIPTQHFHFRLRVFNCFKSSCFSYGIR